MAAADVSGDVVYQVNRDTITIPKKACGAAVGDTLADAFGKAYLGDPLSAYGGVLGFNFSKLAGVEDVGAAPCS